MEICTKDLIHLAILSCILLLEAWLGRTEKTKYSSTLELLILGSLSLAVYLIFKKGEENERR